ncbi:MAG: thioredoxin family protein [Candidatus Asgardarchaeia archaeon]
MISKEDKKRLKEKFSTMPKEVLLKISRTEDCEICDDINKLMEELSSISEGKVKLEYLEEIPEEYRDVGNGPIIVIDDGGIVYLGSPIGHEAWAFVETLVLKSQGDSKLEDEIKNKLKNLKSSILLETIVTPSCPYSPYSVLMANQLAIESKGLIRSKVINAWEFQGEAEKYKVTAVPTTIIYKDGEGEVGFVGVPRLEEVLEKIFQPVEPSK